MVVPGYSILQETGGASAPSEANRTVDIAIGACIVTPNQRKPIDEEAPPRNGVTGMGKA